MRVHDMGGGGLRARIPLPESDYFAFREPWHARALAVTLAAGTLGAWNLDSSRHARERLSPADYLEMSYYERWLAALANLLVERGLLTSEELAEPDQIEQSKKFDSRCLRPESVEKLLSSGAPTLRKRVRRPRFGVGDLVRTKDPAENRLAEGGHTRLPAYAQGRIGRIEKSHGAHVFPDANAHRLGENPEPLYSVQFSAEELWGSRASAAADDVMVDLWESYLTSA